jgi:N4-bis(aminopropyl)spermidine synthase
MSDIDLRGAINAISDIVQNRPPPLREFDQIYMKVADMVLQAQYVADVFDNDHVVFVGDGDSIALSCLHLRNQKLIEHGPRRIDVLDFDERIVNAINRFSEKWGFANQIRARLYNVVDALPEDLVGTCGAFYMNPPWGASNGGESVFAFLDRGFTAVKPRARGMLVIADDPSLNWTQSVLRDAQARAITEGFLIAEMIPQQHLYHLDDAPDLRSCSCLFFRPDRQSTSALHNHPMVAERRLNFYGRNNPLRCRYIREVASLNYGRAPDSTYKLELIEDK